MDKLIVLQHLEIEGPGLFSKIAKERGIEVEIIRLDLEEKIPNLKSGDTLLILGGTMGVKDIGSNKFPWLEEEVKLIKSILNKDIGIIGVCLGAQLLAYAAGGDVEVLKSGYPQEPTPEIGWSEIYLEKEYKGYDFSLILDQPTNVLHWHSDRILLPKKAQLIASSKICKEQLFKIRKKAYGLQFHVESESSNIFKWIKSYEDFVISALGKNGPKILKDKEVIMGNETLNTRTLFINELFDLTK